MKKPLVLVVSIVCLVLSACSSKKTCSEAEKKVLKICYSNTPTSADPRRSGDMVTSTSSFMLFSGLTTIDKNNELQLAIAKNYEISDDHTEYTFHLHPSNWSDGKPLTAHDFEYSWKGLLTPDFPSPCSFLLYPIKNARLAKEGQVPIDEIGIKAVDDYTLVVKLEKPCPYFLKLTTFYTFYPIPKHIDVQNPDWYHSPSSNTVCNGPFKITSWAFDSEIECEKNLSYYDADNVHIDGINISIISDPNTSLQMFDQGKFDWIGDPASPIPVDALAKLSENSQIFSNEIAASVFIPFNINRFPFNNVNIRKAFSYAINRKAITDNITQMNEQPATRFVPPVLAGYDQKELMPADGDRKKALEHFMLGCQELNIKPKDFPSVTLTAPSLEHYKKIAQALQEQIRDVLDINISINTIDLKLTFDALVKRNYDLGLIMFVAQYQDPMNVFERFMYKETPKNYPCFENSDYISLVDGSLNAKSSEERSQIFSAAEKILADEMPLTPVYFYSSHSLLKPNVKGCYMTAASYLHFRDVEFISE